MDYYISPEEFEEAEKRGLSYKTVYSRFYYYNWSKERALTEPKKDRKTKLTQEQIKTAASNGINIVCLRLRLSNGWSMEEAINKPKQKSGRKNVIEDELYELAKKNGINRVTFYSRVKLLGWSIDRALNTPVRGNVC